MEREVGREVERQSETDRETEGRHAASGQMLASIHFHGIGARVAEATAPPPQTILRPLLHCPSHFVCLSRILSPSSSPHEVAVAAAGPTLHRRSGSASGLRRSRYPALPPPVGSAARPLVFAGTRRPRRRALPTPNPRPHSSTPAASRPVESGGPERQRCVERRRPRARVCARTRGGFSRAGA